MILETMRVVLIVKTRFGDIVKVAGNLPRQNGLGIRLGNLFGYFFCYRQRHLCCDV